MPEHITAGAHTLKAAQDHTKYDPFELGEALCKDILDEVWKCIDAHHSIINEPEFCIISILGTDCLIKHGFKRRKFYAWPFLPKPRPNQICFLYEKGIDMIRRLWSLPNAKTMAEISTVSNVAPIWKDTKYWCDNFYKGTFWEAIRKQHDIDLLSEEEFLSAHREELIKTGAKEIDSSFTKPFDFSKVTTNKIVNPKGAILDQYSFDDFRKAQTSDRNVGSKIL